MSKIKPGDTIVEVLFAVSIFGLVAVLILNMMQRGVGISQAALEVSMVRNEINSQAEMIRMRMSESQIRSSGNLFANNSVFESYLLGSSENIQPFDQMVVGGKCQIPDNSFIIDIRRGNIIEKSSGRIVPAGVFPRLVYNNVEDSNKIEKGQMFTRAEGIWVQAKRVTGEGSINDDRFSAIDFHIRACWTTIGSNRPITLGTVVRTYDEI